MSSDDRINKISMDPKDPFWYTSYNFKAATHGHRDIFPGFRAHAILNIECHFSIVKVHVSMTRRVSIFFI